MSLGLILIVIAGLKHHVTAADKLLNNHQVPLEVGEGRWLYREILGDPLRAWLGRFWEIYGGLLWAKYGCCNSSKWMQAIATRWNGSYG